MSGAEMRIDKVRDQLRDTSNAAAAYAKTCADLRGQRDELRAALVEATSMLSACALVVKDDEARTMVLDQCKQSRAVLDRIT